MNATFPLTESPRHAVIIVGSRVLECECLAIMIEARNWAVQIVECVELCPLPAQGSIVLICGPDAAANEVELEAILAIDGMARVVVLSEADDTDTIFKALDAGTRGFVSTASSADLLMGAIGLVEADGIYIPPDSLIAARQSGCRESSKSSWQKYFTPRQAEIVDAVCHGKPNKIIAHELGMCESTVKMHVRKIMLKIEARNRTELAFKANALRDGPDPSITPYAHA